jgi:hypothetical protein
MKIFRILIAIVIVVGILGATFGPTQAQKLAPYSTALNVQNLGSATANITLTFYKSDGSTEPTVTDTLAVNASKSWITLPVSAGFSGSLVISSDQPLAANPTSVLLPAPPRSTCPC